MPSVISPSVPVVLTAGCKVNLFLRITGRRDDGYHTLSSLFWPLDEPSDTLTVTRADSGGLRFTCSEPELETSGNIVVRAYAAFAENTAYAPGIAVHLRKNIPSGAGLGGGSSDAAAMLLYLNRAMLAETGARMADDALGVVGARLGADVPFFLHNTPSLIGGIGDVVTPLDARDAGALKGLHLVLVCPREHVATAWAFKAWDEKVPEGNLTNGGENDTSPHVQGIWIHNDLSRVVFERYPVIPKTVALLEDLHADAASMSGSGSSVFGLFRDAAAAQKATVFFRRSGERVFHHILGNADS